MNGLAKYMAEHDGNIYMADGSVVYGEEMLDGSGVLYRIPVKSPDPMIKESGNRLERGDLLKASWAERAVEKYKGWLR